MKKLFSIMFTVIIFALLFTACGGSAPSNDPASASDAILFKAATWDKILAYQVYYSETQPVEAGYAAAFEEMWKFTDEKMLSLKDRKFLSDNCYSNLDQILDNFTVGMYTKVGTDGKVLFDQQSMISALVTNDLYPGHAAECAVIVQETAKQVDVVYEGRFQKYFIAREKRASLETQYKGTVDHYVVNALLNQYGSRFIGYMNNQLEAHGVPPFPAGFVGMPTDSLHVPTKSHKWCNYYMSVASGEIATPNKNYAPEMYTASWIGPDDVGYCDLGRQAAWEYTGQANLTSAGSNAQACGESYGLSSSVDENCAEVPADSGAVPMPTK